MLLYPLVAKEGHNGIAAWLVKLVKISLKQSWGHYLERVQINGGGECYIAPIYS